MQCNSHSRATGPMEIEYGRVVSIQVERYWFGLECEYVWMGQRILKIRQIHKIVHTNHSNFSRKSHTYCVNNAYEKQQCVQKSFSETQWLKLNNWYFQMMCSTDGRNDLKRISRWHQQYYDKRCFFGVKTNLWLISLCKREGDMLNIHSHKYTKIDTAEKSFHH